jgi:hypothetical protein
MSYTIKAVHFGADAVWRIPVIARFWGGGYGSNMAIFEVPIVPNKVAEAMEAYRNGELGLGPKVARPNVQPKMVPIKASSIHEARKLALKLNPGWAAHQSNIMKARDT